MLEWRLINWRISVLAEYFLFVCNSYFIFFFFFLKYCTSKIQCSRKSCYVFFSVGPYSNILRISSPETPENGFLTFQLAISSISSLIPRILILSQCVNLCDVLFYSHDILPHFVQLVIPPRPVCLSLIVTIREIIIVVFVVIVVFTILIFAATLEDKESVE